MEIFADGSGILVDPADSRDIARGLVEALDNQGDLARRARQRVLTTYTWQKTAEAYAAVISEGLRVTRQPVPEVPALDASDLIRKHLASN